MGIMRLIRIKISRFFDLSRRFDIICMWIIGQAFRLRRLQIGSGPSKKREPEILKKPSWMVPFSHGYHIVEDMPFNDSDASDWDSVVVQREELEDIEVWFFGVFEARVGDTVSKYMQAHFFDRNIKQVIVFLPNAS